MHVAGKSPPAQISTAVAAFTFKTALKNKFEV